MFFELSKIVWCFAAPTNAFLILLAVATVLRWMGFRRLSRITATLTTLSLLIVAFSPVGNLRSRSLVPPRA